MSFCHSYLSKCELALSFCFRLLLSLFLCSSCRCICLYQQTSVCFFAENDPINSPSVICPEERKFYVGETVKIECHADTPKGKILPSELEITWKKVYLYFKLFHQILIRFLAVTLKVRKFCIFLGRKSFFQVWFAILHSVYQCCTM